MKPPTYRLLAVDIDGTLVNSQDQITVPTRDAIAAATRAGIQVVLVTGRQYGNTYRLAQQLKLTTPVVTASGALIKNPSDHQTFYKASFEQATTDRILEIVDDAGFEPVFFTDHYTEGYEYHFPSRFDHNPYLAEFIAANRERGRFFDRIAGSAADGLFAGFAIGMRKRMVELESQLEDALPSQLYLHVLKSPKYAGFFCEIAPAGVTKWSGVCRLAKCWGISEQQICAVGDDVNDIPMLRGAALGVAMGNAADCVKQIADRVAPSHDEDGLASVVQSILSSD